MTLDWVLRSALEQLILEAGLFVSDETVSLLNSSIDGLVANAPDAAANVCKEGGEFRLRYWLLANPTTIGSGCASAACMRCLVVLTTEGSVFLQIYEKGSQIIKKRIFDWDLLRVTRRRYQVRIRCACNTTHQHGWYHYCQCKDKWPHRHGWFKWNITSTKLSEWKILLSSNKLSKWKMLLRCLSMYGARLHFIGLAGMTVWLG